MLLWQLNLQAGGGGGTTGTGTLVAGAALVAALGTGVITASGTPTAGAAVVAGSGNSTIQGTSGLALSGGTLSAAGTPVGTGTGGWTLSGSALAGSGTPLGSGSGGWAVSGAGMAGSGTVVVGGEGAWIGPFPSLEATDGLTPTPTESPFVTDFGLGGPWGNYSEEAAAGEDLPDGSEFYSVWGDYAALQARVERATSTNDPLIRRLGPTSTRRRALSTDLDP